MTLRADFMDNPAASGKAAYKVITVDAEAVLKSWKLSLFSFEWLQPDGQIRAADDMPVRERERRMEIEKRLQAGEKLERPVLGIGLMDNIEIGAGRAEFLTLAALGHEKVSVHVPVAHIDDFESYL